MYHIIKELLANRRKAKLYIKKREFTSDQLYSTNVFYYYKCIFVHIPKAAGVSISKTLFGNLGGGHQSVKEYQKIFTPRTFKSYYKFTFVRNPYTRLYSAYAFLKKGGLNDYDKKFSQKHLSNIDTFEDFVLNYLNEETLYAHIHFYPQVFFLKDDNEEININFIGRFENIKSDFEIIRKQLKINKELPHLNKTSTNKVNDKELIINLSTEVKEKLYELYREDFENLNYTK